MYWNKMNSTILKSLLLFICCFIIAAPPAANGEDAKIRVVYTQWFPYTYQKNQLPSGFEMDIFNSVLKKMNLKAEFKMYPWKRCLAQLKKGGADVLISMLKTPQRERFTYYPDENISISRTMLFKKYGKPILFNGSYKRLEGYRIGVIMGFSYGKTFDQADYLQKDGAVDTKMLITKLLKGRNDLAAENQAVVIATANQMGMRDRIEFLTPPIHTQKLYVGFSKAHRRLEGLCRNFSILLREFKKSEAHRAILEKYGIAPSDMVENIK
ncbi:MAG: transporter substrate-binding domain-containing protein [Desulfobacter sp.]|nr:MAG: transporter substrate-binding domain-containing protein [Desulfobacter sp.]